MKNESALDAQIGGHHYAEMAIQPIVFCMANKLNTCESLAIKYLCRHGKKNGKQDLEKAIHCIQLLIDLEYPGGTPIADKVVDNLRQRLG